MPQPSPRFVFAFQLALALVITYGLTLWFDWERPRWAAFAVISIATPTVGMSLMRGAQRLKGTIMGASVALLIIALFPQDRWWFILSLSLWMALCMYMMGFSHRSYQWQCAGFVCGIIASTAANVQGNSFMLAIDRTLETSLGILVYTAVTLLVWRDRAEGESKPPSVPELYFPDLDQLAAALRMIVIYLLAFLAIVYIPDFPAGLSFLGPLAGVAMGVISMPQVPVKVLHLPVAFALSFASVIYIFIMPLLSGFTELAPLVFIVGFSVSYYFYGTPQANIVRLLVLFVFAALSGINNDQVYTFSAVSNNVLVFTMLIALLHIGAVVPVHMRPEKRFLKLLERFQASTEYLSQPRATDSWLARRKLAFHRHEMTTLPGKIAGWRPFLPPDLAGPLKQELDELLQLMGARQATLLNAGEDEAAARDAAAELASSCAMIDWSPWRLPRF